jgi:hypothetical protein
MSFVRKWMELEIIILSEISQAQKAKYCISTEKGKHGGACLSSQLLQEAYIGGI